MSQARLIAGEFDQLAEYFSERAETGPPNPETTPAAEIVLETSRVRQAGELLLKAYRAGLLPELDGLAERVDHHTSEPPAAEKGKARSARCPDNLFSDTAHGILPMAFPEYFTDSGRYYQAAMHSNTPPDQRSHFLRTGGKEVYRNCASACRLLADMVSQAGEAVAEYLGSGRLRIGRETLRIEGQEHLVLEALVDLQAATKKELEDRSGVTDAVAILKRMLKRHPSLRNHVTLPGGRNQGGYRTTICRADS